MYMCLGAYEQEMYDQCEVGDLSGKYGAVAIQEAGWVTKLCRMILCQPWVRCDVA